MLNVKTCRLESDDISALFFYYHYVHYYLVAVEKYETQALAAVMVKMIVKQSF